MLRHKKKIMKNKEKNKMTDAKQVIRKEKKFKKDR